MTFPPHFLRGLKRQKRRLILSITRLMINSQTKLLALFLYITLLGLSGAKLLQSNLYFNNGNHQRNLLSCGCSTGNLGLGRSRFCFSLVSYQLRWFSRKCQTLARQPSATRYDAVDFCHLGIRGRRPNFKASKSFQSGQCPLDNRGTFAT